MTKPLASVAMVLCNAERFLPESIESVLGQTFREFEFIIVDFGSTDKSEEIASEYAAKDSRIKFHRIARCCLAEARNAACSLAQGSHIAIMDADDVSLPDRLTSELAFMATHPQVALLGGATERIDASGRSLGVYDFPTHGHEISLELANRNVFCQSTVLMRSDAFTLVGGYRAVFVQSEDYDLWLRIAERFEVANLKEVVLKYRIHSHQISIRNQREQTLCKLAAQVSATARRNGEVDPFSAGQNITSERLVALGVAEATQQRDIASDCLYWIGIMSMVGEYSAALKAALELLQSDLNNVERWRVAELHLIVARIYRRQGKFLSSFLATARAVVTRPIVVGHLAQSLLRHFQLRSGSMTAAGQGLERGRR